MKPFPRLYLFVICLALIATGCEKKPSPPPEPEYEENSALNTVFETSAEKYKFYIAGKVSDSVSSGDGNTDISPLPFKAEYKPDLTDVQNIPKFEEKFLYEGSAAAIAADVYIGKDNWMFYAESVADYTGANIYGSEELKTITGKYKKQYDYCKENGIAYYILIAPNKNTVYGDKMPDCTVKGDSKRIDFLIAYIQQNTDIPIIYTDELLINLRSSTENDIYLRYDTHWNQHAAFAATNLLLSRINQDFPSITPFSESDFKVDYLFTYAKDIAWYLGRYEEFSEAAPQYTPLKGFNSRLIYADSQKRYGVFKFAYTDNDGYSDGCYEAMFINEVKNNAPSVLMFRDSFGAAMIPFIRESFSSSVFSWGAFSTTKIAENSPDIVIVEMLERTVK